MNKENRSALPLSVSDITSCVRGYTLAMTASLTYENIEDHAIEGEDRRERAPVKLSCLFASCISDLLRCRQGSSFTLWRKTPSWWASSR